MKYQASELQNPIDDWVIVIIDDMPDNIAVARTALEFHGAKVRTANSGPEGLKMLQEMQPTVILLDIRMPQMDGWEVFKAIRKRSHLAQVPVIAITAYAMNKDRDDVMEAGFDGYVAKPFDIFTFASEIEKLTTRAIRQRQEQQR